MAGGLTQRSVGRPGRGRPRAAGWPSTGRLVAGAIAVVLVTLGLVAVAGALTSPPHLVAGRAAAEEGRAALLDGDIDAAADAFEQARASFRAAEYRLAGLARPLWAVPLVGDNVRAAAAIADAGGLAARGVRDVADAVDALPGGIDALAPTGSAAPLEAVQSLAGPLEGAAERLESGHRALVAARSTDLWGPVHDARADLEIVMGSAATGSRSAAALTAQLPQFFGATSPRRYLFVAQNPAEARGTGGFVGAVAVVDADDGRLELGGFTDVAELDVAPLSSLEPPNDDYAARFNRYGGGGRWQNINLTLDFPSAATAMERLWAATKGEEVDGVIAADPFALAALARAGGPIDVDGVGEIPADDIVEFLSNEAYGVFDDETERKELLGAVAFATLDRFLTGGVDEVSSVDAVRTLATAAAEGHLRVHSRNPEVQAAFETAGIAGRMLPADPDYLAVVLNSGSYGKHDYYLDRSVRYRVALADRRRADADLRVTLSNTTPTSGLPSRVIGPNRPMLEAGEHRVTMSAYCAAGCELTGYDRTRGRLPLETESELGRPVFSTRVQLRSGTEGAIGLGWRIPDAWDVVDGVGRYELTVQGQTAARRERFELAVTVPDGTVVVDSSADLRRVDPQNVVFVGESAPVRRFWVTFGAAPPEGAWARLRAFLSRPIVGFFVPTSGHCCDSLTERGFAIPGG